jgi:hypothetical protein
MTGAALAPAGLAPFSADELLSLQLQLAARAKSPLQTAWIEFLQRFPMQWFCTMTFKHHVHPEAADKLWRVWVSKLNRSLYGVRWYQRPECGIYWIRALELQKREVIHYHALVGDVQDMNASARRLRWMDEWFRLAGIARIEAIESDAAVSAYVSKYVTKGGEIELSGSMRSFAQAQALALPRR